MGGGRDDPGFLRPACFLGLSFGSLPPPFSAGPGSCKPFLEGFAFFLPKGAAVSFGSFCGLGLLFLSTIVRKPLPQKVSAGGLVYRRDTPTAPGEFHTPPTDKEPREQLGFPLSRWVALGQALHLSEPFNHSLVSNI